MDKSIKSKDFNESTQYSRNLLFTFCVICYLQLKLFRLLQLNLVKL